MTQETEREALIEAAYVRIAKELGHEPNDPFDRCLFQFAYDEGWQARARVGRGEVDEPPAHTYYAWLIEQRDINGKPTWLKINNFIHEQTDNAWEALHFGRRVDAEAYAAGNEDEVIYITEHAFPALSVNPVEDKGAIELLRRIEPHIDTIVCYASTMDEHSPNRLAVDLRRFLSTRIVFAKPVEVGEDEAVDVMVASANLEYSDWEKKESVNFLMIEAYRARVGKGEVEAVRDFVCILRHKKHGTVICGWLTAKQYLEAGYLLDWDATDKELRSAQTKPVEVTRDNGYVLAEVSFTDERNGERHTFKSLDELITAFLMLKPQPPQEAKDE